MCTLSGGAAFATVAPRLSLFVTTRGIADDHPARPGSGLRREPGAGGAAIRRIGAAAGEGRRAADAAQRRAALAGVGRQLLAVDCLPVDQDARGPLHLRPRHDAASRPRRELGVQCRRHRPQIQPAQGRHLARRRAVHVRGREILGRGGLEEGPSARTHRVRRRGDGGDPRRQHRHPQAHATLARGVLVPQQLRGPDHPQARLRHRRHPAEPQAQRARRHRAVRVQGVEEGAVRRDDPQSQVLGRGQTLSGGHRRAHGAGRRLARRRVRDGRGDVRPVQPARPPPTSPASRAMPASSSRPRATSSTAPRR